MYEFLYKGKIPERIQSISQLNNKNNNKTSNFNSQKEIKFVRIIHFYLKF